MSKRKVQRIGSELTIELCRKLGCGQEPAVGEGQPLYNEFADGAQAAETVATGSEGQRWAQGVADNAQQSTFDPLLIKVEAEDG